MQLTDAVLRQVVNDGVLPVEVAAEYLGIYLVPANWEHHVATLFQRVTRQGGKSDADLRNELRNSIAFSILLPVHSKSVVVDRVNPEGLFYSSARWRQINERDWFADLRRVIARDVEIHGWRGRVASLGHVDPLEYAPYCRQAYNWLYERADADGWVSEATKPAIKEWCTEIVHLYGGVCVSNLFVRHEDVIARVVNWRTGYHIERAIFEVYTIDQVEKIKTAELQKTNPGLVRSLTVSSAG